MTVETIAIRIVRGGSPVGVALASDDYEYLVYEMNDGNGVRMAYMEMEMIATAPKQWELVWGE